ncbi:rab3 GTPase-activating protein catalytic subunit-like [Dioscorea cayenensis subsp. rotundata]|uniref:Rab3 GTPase-activating protein catalytic subunit-like n=1 Tax=Dioscorea cayennensis subsp. rotundata TaxID=55577 RepID=A0AB40AT60_DIOCR|nr:rab3 GTPase-activating protein catalytic subunit-like [Dioscorea cayenensis subsp. rotundata]
MEASLSFVSRAKTAFHSAAVKAEKVLSDIKADLTIDRERDAQSNRVVGIASDQDMVGADESNKVLEEATDRKTTEEEDNSGKCIKYTVIPATILGQLAVAFERAQSYKSIKDILSLAVDPLPNKDRTGFGFSTVKALVRREKDEKSNSDCCLDEEFHYLTRILFDSEEHIPSGKATSCSKILPMMYLSRDILSAPPESLVVRLSVLVGGFKSLQKMVAFWVYVVGELRRLWSEGKPIPHVPLEGNPDLNSCPLHQQLQVINCCISRQQRRVLATESLDFVLKEVSLDGDQSDYLPGTNQMVYARTSSGHHVLRLGADHPSENLTMLETGEAVYSPVTQEGPVLTEELIKETEEFVLRTGSVGAGCSQLLSDMQAFKAANPGCVLENFVRWHSPPDWTEDSDGEANVAADAEDSSSRRGRLSRRMRKEGNLWRELWETAKPLPAIRQTPLFDEDLAVESILTTLEEISPSELFEQLFVSALCSSFLIAEATLSADSNLSELFYKCKDYVIATYQSGTTDKNLADICKVYETVEKIMTHPEEAVKIMDRSDETFSNEQPKNRFKKISMNFLGKDRQTPLHWKAVKDEKNSQEKQSHVLSNLFDKGSSLFSKMNSKSSGAPAPAPAPSSVPSGLDGTDWTIV